MFQFLEEPGRLDNHTKAWNCPVVILRGSPQPVWQVHLHIDPKVSILARLHLL